MSKGNWTCASCDGIHSGLPDLAMHRPYVWGHGDDMEPNSALRLDGNFLSEDFCVIEGRDYIVRCTLEIPVHGLHLERNFAFGVWSSLSKTNFEAYIDTFDKGLEKNGDPCSSWLCSDLTFFGKTLSEQVWVIPQANRQRPKVELVDDRHPLYKAQKNGLPAKELVKIFEQTGHFPN